MKLGLALAGGGVKGIAHAGILQALEENNIKVDIIGGTSSGGVIASLYAMGYSPIEIFEIFKKNVNDVISINSNPIILGIGNFFGRKKEKFIGFKSGLGIEKSYTNLAKINGIEKMTDIKMPIVIPAFDIEDSREYVFTNYVPKYNNDNIKYITDIPIGRAVRASSSFPAIFCPCDYKAHKFLDGGVLDNIPVLEVKKQGATKVIAVNFETEQIDESSNMFDIAMHTIDIMGEKMAENSLNLSDCTLTIKTQKMGLFNTEGLERCYKYGYFTAIKNLDKIMTLFK